MSEAAPFDWSYAEESQEEAFVDQRIGPYRVLGRLGAGGMGSVLDVEDPGGRRLALKLLPAGHVRQDAIERLRREGEVTAALRHPNVVAIHDAGSVDGRPYLVYERIEGSNLEQVFARLSRAELLTILGEVADGLSRAHEHGVVHRDVKPSNVLLGGDGRPRVADFGLAYCAELESLTRSGALLGTPLYMAPEQVMASRADLGPHTDVWALGVMLHRALTGEEPFKQDTLSAQIGAILSQEPPLASGPLEGVSEGLRAVCLKALDKSSQGRYATAGEFADDLRRACRGEPVEARLVRRRRPVLLVLVSLTALVLSGALLWGLRPPDRLISILAEHAAWQAEALEPSGLTLLGPCELTVEELSERRDALSEAGGDDPRVRAPLALLEAHLLLARAREGRPVELSPRDAERPTTLRVAEALVAYRAGDEEQGRARLALARERDARSPLVRQARFLLEFGRDPQAFFARARANEDARAVWGAHWRSLLPQDLPRAASDAAAAERLTALAKAAAEHAPPQVLRAAGQDALESSSDAWEEALAKGFANQTEAAVIDRLEAFLADWGGGVAGPRLSAAAGRVLQAFANGLEGLRNPRLVALVLAEHRLYYLCGALPRLEGFPQILGTASSQAQGDTTPEQRLALALAILRHAEGVDSDWAERVLADEEDVARRWSAAHPGSRAGRLLVAQLTSIHEATLEELEALIAELELALSATRADVLPVHEAAGWLRLGRARLERLRELPEDRRPSRDGRLLEAADRALELGGARASLFVGALSLRQQAVELLEGAQASLSGWEEALREFDRRSAAFDSTTTEAPPGAERGRLLCDFARSLQRAGHRKQAWIELSEAFDLVLRGEPPTRSGPIALWAERILWPFVELGTACGRAAEVTRQMQPYVPRLFSNKSKSSEIVVLLSLARRAVGDEAGAEALLDRLRKAQPNGRLPKRLRRRLEGG